MLLRLIGKVGLCLGGLHQLLIFVLVDVALAWYRLQSGNDDATYMSSEGM